MKIITFLDFDNNEIIVRSDLIESVRKPSGLTHDHGGLTLTTGREHSFNLDFTAARVIRELLED